VSCIELTLDVREVLKRGIEIADVHFASSVLRYFECLYVKHNNIRLAILKLYHMRVLAYSYPIHRLCITCGYSIEKVCMGLIVRVEVVI